MKTKLIAFALVFAIFASLSPAVAADEVSAQPTIEEILKEYHQKVFEEQTRGDTDTASIWSRRSGNTTTLEQQTVDTLTNAGYEAYNVTPDNYNVLEAELNTDFAAMGLDPSGSYIVAISGEGSPECPSSGGQSTFGLQLPGQEQAPDGGGSSFFTYTCNGKTYYMRYFTVTAVDNAEFGRTSEVDLLEELGPDEMLDALSIPMSIISYLPGFEVLGVTNSVLSDLFPDVEETRASALEYRGGTTWTVTYLEVYNSSTRTWRAKSSVEYVTPRYFIDYTYVDSTTMQYEEVETNGTHEIQYSEHYGDYDWMKEKAVLSYEYDIISCYQDTIDIVEYVYAGEVVISHHRTLERIEDRP